MGGAGGWGGVGVMMSALSRGSRKFRGSREWLYTHRAQGLGEARGEEGSPGLAGSLDLTTRALKNFKSDTQPDN